MCGFWKTAWFVPNFQKCNTPFINETSWNYCTKVYMWVMNGESIAGLSISACLEVLDMDENQIHETTMKLSHGTVKVKTASDFTYFHDKPNGFLGLTEFSLYMAKSVVIWEMPLLPSDPSFFCPRRQVGQTAPLAPHQVGLTFPSCSWE